VQAFEYVAADAAGKAVAGLAWAADELELDARLDGQGLVLTRARKVAGGTRTRPIALPRSELIQLTTQLATVTAAGLPLLEGLAGIRARAPGRRTRQLLSEMISALEAGQTFSDVLAQYPRSFPDVYRASVVAGEASGSLDKVLVRMAAHLEWVRGMRATTIQALIYPALLACALVGLIAILLFFLLPRIVTMFPGGVAELPAQTRFVLAASQALRSHALLLAALLAMALGGLTWALRSARGRVLLDRIVASMPVLGPVARQLATSKFAGTAAILQAAGCDVFTVMDVAARACGNAHMAAAFARARERIRRGDPLAQALADERSVDPLLVQLVSVGERAGELDKCLERVAAHYDTEIPRSVKRMLSLLEPALLVVAGAIVAFLLLAALLPMFQLMESIH
jgi:general secretion pathway protein F